MDPNPSFGTTHTPFPWNRVYPVLYLSYFLLGLTIRIIVPTFADTAVFMHATRQLLGGSLDIYSYLTVPESAPPLGTGYTYPPLLAIIFAPFVGVADLLGLSDDWASKLTVIPLLLFDILAMQQFRRLVRTWRPAVDERLLFLGVFISLMLTGFLFVSAERGHHEGLVLLGVLLTLRFAPTNIYLAGLSSALALAAKQTALLELIPVGLVILTTGLASTAPAALMPTPSPSSPRNPSGISAFAIWAGIAGGLFLALMLPFWLTNPPAVQYAFFTALSRLTLYGPGLPIWIDKAVQSLASPTDYPFLHDLLLSLSNPFVVAIVLAASLAAVYRALKRRNPITLTDPRLLALVAFAGVSQVAFGKWVGGHYYQLPLLLVFLWDIVRTTPRSSPPMPTIPASATHTPWNAFPLPLLGILASIAFRSVTSSLNDGHLADLKSVLLLLLYLFLAAVTLRGSFSPRDT